MIDSHCHLHYDYAPKTTEQLVAEAAAAGVSHLVTVGVDLESAPAIAAISERFETVVHTVGVHPHDAGKLEGEWLQSLRQFAQHPKCRAIGEVGLDYYYEHSDRAAQMHVLEAQLELALELKLPVVIHGRDAEEDLLPRLLAYAERARKTLPRTFVGALHCFTGTHGFAARCIEAGFVVSFSGILTFKTAEDLRATARALPLDRLMVETDSPYLAPIPFRGKKCEPAMVVHTAQVLADLHGVSLAGLDAATTRTTRELFGITSN